MSPSEQVSLSEALELKNPGKSDRFVEVPESVCFGDGKYKPLGNPGRLSESGFEKRD
jgi:hypothetical protein